MQAIEVVARDAKTDWSCGVEVGEDFDMEFWWEGEEIEGDGFMFHGRMLAWAECLRVELGLRRVITFPDSWGRCFPWVWAMEGAKQGAAHIIPYIRSICFHFFWYETTERIEIDGLGEREMRRGCGCRDAWRRLADSAKYPPKDWNEIDERTIYIKGL